MENHRHPLSILRLPLFLRFSPAIALAIYITSPIFKQSMKQHVRRRRCITATHVLFFSFLSFQLFPFVASRGTTFFPFFYFLAAAILAFEVSAFARNGWICFAARAPEEKRRRLDTLRQSREKARKRTNNETPVVGVQDHAKSY